MKFIIFTNNDLVVKKYNPYYEVLYKNVGCLDLFNQARDLVHKGYKILTHPLSGSVKPNENPYKTILITKSYFNICESSLMIIENSINISSKFAYKDFILTDEIRKDFKMVDLSLIESALDSII